MGSEAVVGGGLIVCGVGGCRGYGCVSGGGAGRGGGWGGEGVGGGGEGGRGGFFFLAEIVANLNFALFIFKKGFDPKHRSFLQEIRLSGTSLTFPQFQLIQAPKLPSYIQTAASLFNILPFLCS